MSATANSCRSARNCMVTKSEGSIREGDFRRWEEPATFLGWTKHARCPIGDGSMLDWVTLAIIEWPDGRVDMCEPCSLRFVVSETPLGADNGIGSPGFAFVDVVSPGCEGTLNLMFDGYPLAFVNNVHLAQKIRDHINALADSPGDDVSGEFRWRSIHDLPEQGFEEDEEDERCVVSWVDAENPSDMGLELTCLAHIRRGDYVDHRYHKPMWRSLFDTPSLGCIAELELDEQE